MILLRANAELKVVFMKLINTMGRKFQWTDLFIIKDNSLVLAGPDGILMFDFGNRAVGSNAAEVNLKEDSIVQITKNEILENALNMTLYAFGKWGKIKGLTVERDYPQINTLFGNLLKEIAVEPVLTAENLRFFREGIQITYEELIQLILDRQKEQDRKECERTDSEGAEEAGHDKGKYDIGLWHKIVWNSTRYSFEKSEMSEAEKVKSRIGNNFYKVNYNCPICKGRLSMVIYPEGEEQLVETDEKGVYLARAYTCPTCHRLYTPRPHLLLAEGSVYSLDFEDDREAYEDFLEVLGKKGVRTYNCNFNEYEAEYGKNKKENEQPLEELCDGMPSLSDQEVIRLKDKMDSGFYPQKSVELYNQAVIREIKKRRILENPGEENTTKKSRQERLEKNAEAFTEAGRSAKASKKHRKKHRPVKKSSRLKQVSVIKLGFDRRRTTGQPDEPEVRPEYEMLRTPEQSSSQKTVRSGSDDSVKAKDNTESLQASRAEKNYLTPYRDQESTLRQKAESCKDKDYRTIVRIMDEISREDTDEAFREELLQPLVKLRELRGRKELDALRKEIPYNLTKKQYLQWKDKLSQYKEIDYSSDLFYLEKLRDEAEKQEITAFIRKAAAKDRASHMQLYQDLKKEGFEDRNLTPFLENVHDKIYAMDEALIKKICGDPADLSFEEGLEAYRELEATDLLPELKTNILSTIDKRLTKIKMNECEQLVNKLSKEMGKSSSGSARIHFYEVRRGLRSSSGEEADRSIDQALNSYASGRGRYEFPILICDASWKENGRRGFVLTPDHIFYNTLTESGTLEVLQIEDITSRSGKNIYAKTRDHGRVKLSNSLQLKDIKGFCNILNEFVSYLKEKPESRDIAYIAKEKHSVKCCYRCGHVYRGDNICPKCGAKFNE